MRSVAELSVTIPARPVSSHCQPPHTTLGVVVESMPSQHGDDVTGTSGDVARTARAMSGRHASATVAQALRRRAR